MIMIYPNEETYRYDGVSGIYALFYNKEIIYIGQSKDVGERLEQHLNTNTAIRSLLAEQEIVGFNTPKDPYYYRTLSMYCFITAHYDKIGIGMLCDCPVGDLNGWEESFIKEYKPRFNYGGVDAPYHEFRR